MNFLKRLLYKGVEFDSRNMQKLGNALGWDWLENEGKSNVSDPSRALRKAALAAASIYAGGALGGMFGGEAGAAAGEGLGGSAGEAAAAAGMGGGMGAAASQIPAGLENTMEYALVNSGYTPSSLMNALQLGGGSGQGMGTTLGNYATNLANTGINRFTSDPMGSLMAGAKGMGQGSMIGGMFGGANPPPRPMQAPPMGGGASGPLPEPYGSGGGLDLTKIDVTKLSPQELELLKRLLASQRIG